MMQFLFFYCFLLMRLIMYHIKLLLQDVVSLYISYYSLHVSFA